MTDSESTERPEQKSRILMLCKAFAPAVGGVESYSTELAKAYCLAGFDVDVVTQHPGQGGLAELQLGSRTLSVHNVGRGGQAVVALKMRRMTQRLRRQHHYVLVHATTWRPAIVLLGSRGGGPDLVTAHGREFLNTPTLVAPLEAAVFRRAKKVIAVSSATRDALVAAVKVDGLAAKVQVVPNGLSFRRSAVQRAGLREDSASGSTRLFTVARLVKRKNVANCLRAVASLGPEQLARVDYRIAGSGPESGDLERLAVELGLSDRVTFLGRISDEALVEEYLSASIFLHPQTHVGDGNDFEGFGIVIADAMSFGAVVVAGVAGGPRDFVVDHETGMLVDGLEVSRIAGAITELLADPELRRRVGERGRRWVLENLDWARHASACLTAAGAGVAMSWPARSTD